MAKITILVGSVYGGSEFVAEQAQALLEKSGHQVTLELSPVVDCLKESDAVLAITSTTGQGDVPDNLLNFYSDARDQFPLITGKKFGVIGLGDSSYGETFCGAGLKLQELMFELQGQEALPLLKIDACETMEPETLALPWVEQWSATISS